ncbi:MAG: GntR family transcriptional regulator [Gammaproteobacteria bacterium]|nr:GntR family transcriptional regulator [Gammaproteobacteria bacterium]MBL7000779.1 GntR family transcriptional regulator [Gammaproteobacteria bacterium]
MIEIGHSYELKVIKKVDFGVYLDAAELGEILLPNRHLPEHVALGDSIQVFLYLDSEDRPVATTQSPKAKVGEFAYLKVVDSTEIGAFLDWGLDKDLLVPFAEQHRPMEVEHSYIVYLYIDKRDGRITASSKIDKFLDDLRPHQFRPQQKVDLLIANTTDLGFKAIINNSHWGVLYQDEVFQRLSFGQSKKGFIKSIRADGKIDLSLQGGQETRDKYAKIILIYLQKQNGFAPVHDKSDPQLISRLFGMSKGAFKKAIGGLYKQRIISIEKDGIRLIQS